VKEVTARGWVSGLGCLGEVPVVMWFDPRDPLVIHLQIISGVRVFSRELPRDLIGEALASGKVCGGAGVNVAPYGPDWLSVAWPALRVQVPLWAVATIAAAASRLVPDEYVQELVDAQIDNAISKIIGGP